MKHLLLLAFAMILGSQARASVSVDEFVDSYVAQMNRRLVFTNQDRIAVQKRPYCTGLSNTQVQTIKNIVRENSEQTTEEFLTKLSDELKCYPIAFPQLKREGWGILTNTKAFWMDIELVRATLRDLTHRPIDGKEKLLDSITLHEVK
ncbi:hypothetical protein [Bdellovibrio sp. KM01]|uniref:hypothetical protein n=1 Tax=Bdellovibrio sp. KM01 TaxID=2748865 RepID=UPI0015E98809|nr:hypothetical protein [Bdellovibrio sp. KM01]QLY24397.1 hypothetical protein HW988_13120 [Bdellovibrio sp. KM01]